MSNQPTWKLVYATDCEALYTDETGVYDPELAVLQEYETERGTTRFQVYRFPLDRCYLASDDAGTFLTDMNPARTDLPHPLRSYRPWFVTNHAGLAGVARFIGATKADLIAMLCSEDPRDLASAYNAIGGYHGFDNFDSEPQDWTESEARAWPERGKMRVTIETNDDDDGMVLLTCDDPEACDDDQSVLGSHWETPGDMDTGYASVMDRADLVTVLEADGYDVDSSEWSPPSAEDFARWEAKANGTWVDPEAGDDDSDASASA